MLLIKKDTIYLYAIKKSEQIYNDIYLFCPARYSVYFSINGVNLRFKKNPKYPQIASSPCLLFPSLAVFLPSSTVRWGQGAALAPGRGRSQPHGRSHTDATGGGEDDNDAARREKGLLPSPPCQAPLN